MVGRHIPRLSWKPVFDPLVVSVSGARVGATGQARNVMTAHVGNHQRTWCILVLAAIGPEIEMLVVLVAGDKDVVHHGVIEHEISLTVQPVRTHVSVDGPVLGLVVFKRMTRPTHGRFTLEVDVVAHGLKPFIDLSHQVGHRQILNVLDSVNAGTVEVERLHPPQRVGNHLLGSLSVLPVDIRHVRRELAVEPMLGPIAVRLTADAT